MMNLTNITQSLPSFDTVVVASFAAVTTCVSVALVALNNIPSLFSSEESVSERRITGPMDRQKPLTSEEQATKVRAFKMKLEGTPKGAEMSWGDIYANLNKPNAN